MHIPNWPLYKGGAPPDRPIIAIRGILKEAGSFPKQSASWNVEGNFLLCVEITSRQGRHKVVENCISRQHKDRGPTTPPLIDLLLALNILKKKKGKKEKGLQIDCTACGGRHAHLFSGLIHKTSLTYFWHHFPGA